MTGRRKREEDLKPAHQKPIRHQLGISIHAILQQRKHTPADIQERDEPRHRDFGEQIRERDLADHRADCIHGLQMDELVAMQSQVFLEAGDVGII